jgi:hypothetical protein
MTVEDIEKLLAMLANKGKTTKLIMTLDKLPPKNYRGEYNILEKVPAELLEHIEPNTYVFIVKTRSLITYVKKMKEKTSE